jgi:hypothetical protein
VPYFNDPVAEIIDLYAYQARQERLQQAASQFTPQTAQMVSSYARNTPWMPAGVNLSLSRAGIPPTDPRIEQISNLALFEEWHDNALAAQAKLDNSFGGAIKVSALSPGGTLGARAGFAIRGMAEQKQREELGGMGWASMDDILAEHPNLRSAVNASKIVIDDEKGLAQRPRNTLTRKGRAFERLKEAFADENVALPFINADERWGEENERMGLWKPSGERTYIDEELFPQARTSSPGGGVFAGARVDAGPVNKLVRRPDPQTIEGLQQAGVPIDPENPFAAAGILTRPATILMDAPAQEIQGQFRNVIGAVRGKPVNWTESQSDLGVVLGAAQQGRPISAGRGFFVDPESEVARERRDREAKRGLIGGHNITIGRFLADTVTEPDTKPFAILSGTVDAGVALADPSTLALGKIGRIRKARALFEVEDAFHVEAGLVNGLRRTVHGPTAATWLNGRKGQRAIEALTNETSPARVWIAMNRRIDPEVAAQFADTRTTADTRNLLEGLLGPQIRSTTEMKAATRNLAHDFSDNPMVGALNNLSPRISQSRLLRWMPQSQADTQNPRVFAVQLERHMVNAKVPIELQEEVLNDIARSPGRGGLLAAATKAMEHEAGVLVQYGVTQEHARSLTTLFRETYGEHLAGFVDEVASDVPVWTKMQVNGQMTDVPGPHLVTEHLARYVPLPDARKIRRLTSNPGTRILTTTKSPGSFGQNRFPIAAMDFLTQEIWKTSTLLGRFPAWITRVVGESQLRMATAGLDSMFHHPLAYFGWALGKRGSIDPSGITITELDEFRNSLTQGHGGWLSRPGVVSSSRPVPIPNRPEFSSRFRGAWANELTELSYDPISKFILNNGINETERWLLVADDGRKHLDMLRASHPGNLQSHQQIQDYLHSISRRITIKTGGDTALIEALKTGKMADGTPLIANVNQTNPKFVKALDAHMGSAPDAVKGLEVDFQSAGHQFYDRWNRAVDSMFAMTMGFADNLWDRAPTFKQYLWQHTIELLPFADDAARAAILANAAQANLPQRMMRGLQRAAKRAPGKGTLAQDELTFLAKGYAVDSSKRLLYDLNEKGQLADAARIIAPFGNAYQEIFGAWGRLLTDIGGPGATGRIVGSLKLLRRADQLLEGARGSEFGELMGAPLDADGTQQGFFFKDQHDQEVFVIPGSQWLTQSISGVPVPLTGSVQGLNMVGSIVPGLGPVAAIPVAWMIQNKPQFQGVKDLLLPYGAPGEREPSDITQLLSYAPPWMRRAFDAASNGGYDQRLWGNAQKDAMAYLYSTGEYDTTTRSGMQQLTHDAKRAARDLYYIRSFAQTFSPTTPSFRFLTEDKSGRLLATSVLVEEFHELQETDYENAAQLFMEQYGENAILSVIPKSGSSTYGIPRTQEAQNFILTNPELKNDFPSTYGFFLPQDEDHKFDYDVYIGSFVDNDRQDITPAQWLNLANATRGDYLYDLYKKRVGSRTDQAATDYLRQARQKIMELYPSGPTGLAEKPDTEDLIAELYKTLDDEVAMSTDAGKGIQLYLQYRDQAMEYVSQIPGRTSFSRSRDTEPVRIWLNNVAQAIMERHPDFQLTWDIVLSRETHVESEELVEG